MGTWDTGNFDNDGARDFLDELIERLSETVGEILADDQRAALDEDGEAVVMPTIDLLAVLCDRYGSTAPAAATIVAWRERYPQIFDDQIDDLAPAAGFKDERRAVIVHTFERLLDCAYADGGARGE